MAISGRVLSPPGRVDLKPARGVGADSISPGGEGVVDQNAAGRAIRHFQHSEASIRPFRPAQEWKWRRTRPPRQISECCGCREASECIALAERFQEL